MSPRLKYAVFKSFFDKGASVMRDLHTGNQVSIIGESSWVRWSPDETMFVMALYDKEDFSLYIQVYNSTSGVNISMDVSLGMNTYASGLCWFPSPLISVLVSQHDKPRTVLRYLSNGTLVSAVQLPIARQPSPFPTLDFKCNSFSLVSLIDDSVLQVMDLAGNIFTQAVPDRTSSNYLGETVLIAWQSGPRATNMRCQIYDTALKLLMELPNIFDHKVIGLAHRDRNLVTAFNNSIYLWDIQTPHVQVVQLNTISNNQPGWIGPYQTDRIAPGTGWVNPGQIDLGHQARWQSSDSYQTGWIDRDHVMIKLKKFNIRTGQYADFLPTEVPAQSTCVLGDKVFLFLHTELVIISLEGKELLRRDLAMYDPDYTFISCSPQGFVGGTFKGWNSGDKAMDLLVWNSSGFLLQNISSPSPFSVSSAICNTSHLAVADLATLYFWNPQTSTFEESTLENPDFIKWSPNCAWLLVIRDGGEFSILDSNREIVMTDTANAKIGSWSYDSNWFALDGSPIVLGSPTLKRIYFHEDINANKVYWSPYTMEILSIYKSELRVWIPPPSILDIVIGNQVGNATSTKIGLFGANFLPLNGNGNTMIHWVDSSTAVPQCMFVSGTVTDAWTLSLGNITLPDPATYTVHVRYPTFHPTSPWVSSELQFAASCGGVTIPAMSQTGGLTSCVCPHDYYTVPNITQLQCNGCPANSLCNGTSVVLSQEGYWPRSEDPYQFLPCAAGACQGSNRCKDCHQGPLCGLCEQSCGQYGFGRCHSCNPVWIDLSIVTLGVLLWIGVCIVQSLFALGWRNKQNRGNNSAQLAAILLSTTQINSLLLSVDVKVEPLSKILGFTEQAVQGGGIQSAVVSCLFIHSGWHPNQIHLAKQVILLMLPFLGWIVLRIARACLQCRGITASQDMAKVSTVVVWSSLQAAVMTSLFQTISCRDVNSQGFSSRLKHDISVPCHGNTYWTFVGVVTLPAIGVTIFIIPLTIAWLLRYRPLASESGYLRFLVKSYRYDWWYLVIFYRKVLLCVVVTFTKNPFHVATTLFISATIHFLVSPSTSFLVNASETMSLTASALIFGVAGALGIINPAGQFGAAELISVGMLSYCVQLGLLIFDRCSSHASKVDDQEDILVPVTEQGVPSHNSHTHTYSRLVNEQAT